MHRSNVIDALRERLAAPAHAPLHKSIETFAIPLRTGAVHEWLGAEGDRQWIAPLAVLVDLARRASAHPGAGELVWIGSRAWPHPQSLVARNAAAHDPTLLHRSLFVEAPDPSARLWAIDAAARSSAVAAVIADGAGFDMSASRRLQLAAESTGAIVLLTRPAADLKALSAATTRWLVRRIASPHAAFGEPLSPRPRWTVELVRCKGVQPAHVRDERRAWTVEWNRDACTLVVPAGLEDRPCEASDAPIPFHRLTG